MARCEVCFRHCEIKDGGIGFCGARTCEDDKVVALNYGLATCLALDPIEKKPLNRFHPGSSILSFGSFGCNLRCPFCQNHDISWSKAAMSMSKVVREKLYSQAESDTPADFDTGYSNTKYVNTAYAEAYSELKPFGLQYISPETLAATAEKYKDHGNIGVAFTYNEPLVGYEYIRDAAKLIKGKGMFNVLVTNGTAELNILEEIIPYIDAMNIDLKGFTDRYYRDVLGGDRQMVMNFIARAVKSCHVELTTLIIPGENDSEDEMHELTDWIAGLSDADGNVIGKNIPLHISRFFPRFKMTDRDATDVAHIYHLAGIAKENLTWVYTGNC